MCASYGGSGFSRLLESLGNSAFALFKIFRAMFKIFTERLVLRNFLPCDAEGLFDYLKNPRASCFFSERCASLEEASLKVSEMAKSELAMAVCLRDGGALIGNLDARKEAADSYSVAWHFNSKFEGRGFAFEAARAYFDFLFKDLSARRIFAYVEEDNLRSQKLCSRLGMRKEGVFVEFVSFCNYPDGSPKYEDSAQYAILRREWEGGRLQNP